MTIIINASKEYWSIYRNEIPALIKGILIILGIAYVFYGNLAVALLFVPYLGHHINHSKSDKDRKRSQELCIQFKDGIAAVSFSLNVGYSIENSFKEAVSELVLLYGEESEIVSEFRTIVHRININENIEDILEDFAVRSGIEDIIYFAEVFRYAKRSGGDLIAIIRNTSKTISEKIETKKEIETVISGKKMEQKIMSIIPFGIIVYLKLSAPEFVQPLYGNAFGAAAMTFCLVLYCISVWMAEKIVDIKV